MPATWASNPVISAGLPQVIVFSCARDGSEAMAATPSPSATVADALLIDGRNFMIVISLLLLFTLLLHLFLLGSKN
ncbi:MAG: hypothetical protein MnENMB40S_34900 [Rhizobiaceae bacterium MnEN-MB40S]|nr:MAG: hypothetical protein MnENMB40S_34900 [Rhizobiaceae bacterium MnEN-MB40S]